MNFALVFFGGGLGSLLRYGIGLLFQKSSLELPLATLFSNVVACCVFALTLVMIEQKNTASPYLRMLVLTGFCGGLSTFSTFGFETWMLLRQQSYSWTFINIAISLVLCIGAFMLIKK